MRILDQIEKTMPVANDLSVRGQFPQATGESGTMAPPQPSRIFLMVVQLLKSETMIMLSLISPCFDKQCPCFVKSFSVSGCSFLSAILTSAVIRMQFSKEFAENIARPEHKSCMRSNPHPRSLSTKKPQRGWTFRDSPLSRVPPNRFLPQPVD